MKEIQKTKEAQVLIVDHDEAVDVSDSDDDAYYDEDDLDLEKETVDYRSPSSLHRHTADLRLRSRMDSSEIVSGSRESERPESREMDASGGDVERAQKTKASTPKIPLQSKYAMLRKSVGTFDQKFNGDHSVTSRTSLEDPEDSGVINSRSVSSISSSASGFQSHPTMSRQLGGHGDSRPDMDIPIRPRSRGQTTDPDNLGPLRAPSPSSAQAMSAMRSKQIQSPPSPRSPPSPIAPRRLR